ncbi:hypothetical protein AADZ91_02915 [Colwelliaceae bacterium 6441]
MYQEMPDFQKITKMQDLQLIAAFGQNNFQYSYPNAVEILDQPSLEFLLTIVRSYTSESIYGTLNFTSSFVYSTETVPSTTLSPLPIIPYKLSFQSPLMTNAFECAWNTATDANFVVQLNTAQTELMEQTLTSNVIGFNARLDGFVKGISPRLAFQLEFDPGRLINSFSSIALTNLEQSKNTYGYDDLVNYLAKNISSLAINSTPNLSTLEVNNKVTFCQALLDRLYSHYGQPAIGDPSDNNCYLTLVPPKSTGRLMIDLNDTVLVFRPICYLFNPFIAAQQLARVSVDKIISRVTAPEIPSGQKMIDVLYALPSGLSLDVSIDVQISLLAGNIYPQTQKKTIRLSTDKQKETIAFINNNISYNKDFTYQVIVNYLDNGVNKQCVGDIYNGTNNVVSITQEIFPCEFFTLTLAKELASSCHIQGTYSSGSYVSTFDLSSAVPCISNPIVDKKTYAMIKAVSLSKIETIDLPNAINQSTQIGSYLFKEFGAQQATITVNFLPEVDKEIVHFETQDLQLTEHMFISPKNHFLYQWNAPSIFKSKFRYKTKNSPWSDYLSGDQTITLGTTS